LGEVGDSFYQNEIPVALIQEVENGYEFLDLRKQFFRIDFLP